MNRVVQRQLEGHDASEADVAVLDWQKENWEPVGSEESWLPIGLDTRQIELGELVARITALENPASEAWVPD